jgi:hypothetical protein
MINALPGSSSLNTVQQARIEEAVFSVVLTNVPIDWLDNDHAMCVYYRSMSVPRLYDESRGALSAEQTGTSINLFIYRHNTTPVDFVHVTTV